MAKKEKKEGKLKLWVKTQVDKAKAWYNKDDNYLRKVRFPGTKLPFLDVVRDFIKLFTKGRTMDRAAGVAFNFFVALFPLVLFFFTLIPYIPIKGLYDRVMMLVKDFLIPSGTLDFVTETIDSIMNQPHEGILSLSIVLCLVFGSGGIVAFFNGFRNVYANYVRAKELDFRGWLEQRVFAIIMLVIIGVLIILSVLLISLGGNALYLLVKNDIIEGGSFVFFMFTLLRWIVAIIALCFGLAILYYFGNVKYGEHYRKELKHPDRKGRKYREFVVFSPGTIMATTLFVLGTVGFNIYISNFSRYNVLYGSIGTLIILLLWIWIVAILILAGNDLNSGIRRGMMKLSETETQTHRKEIVVEDLRKHIQTYQNANEYRQNRINELKKKIKEESVLIDDLEAKCKDYELIIRAYEDFVERERQSTDDAYLNSESEED